MPQMVDEAGNIWEVDAQGKTVFVGKQGAQQQQQGPVPVTLGQPRVAPPEKPQTMKLDDGSVVQIFADGTVNTVVQGTPKTGGASPKGGVTAKIRADAIQAFQDAAALERAAKQLREMNAAGPGATEGLAGLYDYLPTEANQQFDTAAQRARGYVKRSLGFTGGEGNTVAESSTLYDPYLPSTSDRDAKILDKIAALEGLAADARRNATVVLGGVPDQFGNITQPQEVAPQSQQQNDQAVAGNVPQQDRSNQAAVLFGGPGQDGGGGGFAPYGATMKTEANPQWKGVNQAVKGMIVAGRPSQEIKAFMNSKGIAGDAASGIDDAINYYRQTGKQDFGVDVENIQVPMSGLDQFRNNAPQTRLGTAAATALNAGGFGIPQALAGGEGLDYLRQQNPGSAFAGDVAGVIGGTAALGRAGGAVAGKLAPSLLGGGAKSAAGRQLATDATYGGIYGATTEGDPLTGAATAAIGSGLGMGVGRGIQKGLQGVTDPAVQYLTQRGIPLSLGEMLGNNSVIGRNMQKLESMPYLGDLMAARRGEAKDAVYRAALEDSVAPVRGQLDAANPLASAQQTVSGAYDNALGDVTVPFDARFADEFGNARNMASNLPPDLRGKFDAAMASRVDPLAANRSNLPMPSQLNTPRAPTVEEMRNFSRVEDVPLSAARSGQSQMAWNEQNAGKYAEPLIDGFADRPVAVRLENGEYVIKDGNHRTVRAFNDGQQSIPAYVLDAKAFDPANAGRAAAPEQQSVDELLAALTDAGMTPAVTQATARQALPTAITGKQYQQTMRGLSGYKAEATKPGFEQDYRDAISMVQDALKGQMMRNGGESVVTGLNQADQAYSILKPIEQATITARGTPTPKQMLSAFNNNTKKYGGVGAAARGDKVPDVIRYAAENAPTISNSGTADRLGVIAPLLLPTALGGASYSVSDMSPASAGFLATLAAMSTKTGQKALQKAVTSRSPALRKAGGMFGRRKAQKVLSGAGAGGLLSYMGD